MIRRGRRAKLLVAIVSLLVSLLLAEVGTRLIDSPAPGPDPDVLACVPDSLLGWIFPPDSKGVFHGGTVPTDVASNSLGLRNRPLDSRADIDRVAVLGDSYAFGWGVAEADAFPRRLEASLRSLFPDRPLEVINAALPGYSIYQQMRMVEYLRGRMQLEAVVATISLSNDIVDEMRVRRCAPDRLADYDRGVRDPRAWTTRVIRASRLLTRLDEKTLHWRFCNANADEAALDRCLESLRALAAQCREAELPLLWLVVPRVQEIWPGGCMNDRLVTVAETQRARIETLAAETGVPLLDLRPALIRAHAEADVFLPDDPHWTAAGHAAVAEALLPALLAIWKPEP